MRIFNSTADSAHRAVTGALCAALTFIGNNRVRNKILTYAGRTYLIGNVSHIFVTEEFKGCKHGVRRSLTETAKGVLLNVVAKLFHSVKVFKRAVALGDFIEQFKQSLCTYAAGCELTAALINRKLKEEFSHINHTGVFVHNNKSARTHHTADSG